MQTAAITMVRQMPGKEITEALVKELPNLPVAGQVQLLSALADRGDRTALPAVSWATKAKDSSVREAALKALGQLGDASSVALLSRTAANGSDEEQKAARESLSRLRGSEIDKEILANVISAEPKVKVELIRAIGQRNITAAGVETLLKTAREPDRTVALESVKALKIIANEKYLPALVELLINIENESVRSEAEKTIAAVAHKIEDKNRQAEAVLAALPKVSDIQDRCSLLSVLGRIGDDSALPVLREAVESRLPSLQDAAIRALSDWPNPKPINDLLTVAKTSKNEIHRILALRGFVRLIGTERDRPASRQGSLTGEELVRMYRIAMELSADVREKRMVLSGLSNVKSLAALQFAASYLQDVALAPEAEVAVVKIAEGIFQSHPQQAKDALSRITQVSKNDSLRKLAHELLVQIEQLKTQKEDGSKNSE